MATSILPGTTRSGGHARTYRLGVGLRMRGATSGKVGILPPAVITDYDLTLPGALAASDKLLQVSSAGVISLVDPVGPAGSGTELQYRNGSAFGAVTGSSWNGTTLGLPKISAISTTANQLIVGYDTTYQISLNVSSAGVLTLAGYAPAGSNVAAGIAYLDVPRSTGNATPGSWVFRSTVAGSSGSTSQTLADTLTVSNENVRVHNKLIGSNASVYYLQWAAGRLLTAGLHGINNILTGNVDGSLGVHAFTFVASAAGNKLTDTDAEQAWMYLQPRIGQSGTASYCGILLDVVETTLGSGANRLIDLRVGGVQRFFIGTNGTARLAYDATYCTDFAVSSAGNLTITPSGGLASLAGDFAVASTNYHYWGASDTDGSWRMGRSGDNFVIERRESGSWVTKSTIAAA